MGRGRRGYGRGRSSGRGRNPVRVIGNYPGRGNHADSIKEKYKLGISKALGNSMFTYREKNSADKMQTTWEKTVQNTGIVLGQDISTEFQTRTLMVI